MKKLFKLSIAAVLSGLILSGCATTKKKEAPPPAQVVQAVVKSLDHAFSKGWSGIKIFVQRSNLVPAQMNAIGTSEAEVLDREELIAKYEYEKVSPAMAVVDAVQDVKTGKITVNITYRPIKMKYHSIPYEGGEYEYVYKIKGGKLIMVRSSVSLD